jgi:hypothetical protein
MALVCYGVYGNRNLDDVFERYAMAWSTRLGLPLAKGEDHVLTGRVRPLTVRIPGTTTAYGNALAPDSVTDRERFG